MSKIIMTKVYCLDENIIFPSCYKCKEELKLYRIDEEELEKLSDKTIALLILAGLLRIDSIKKDEHLIMVCKNCLTKGN